MSKMLTAYCMKTKEKNVPMQDAVITKTSRGGYMAQHWKRLKTGLPKKPGKFKLKISNAAHRKMSGIFYLDMKYLR